jgi:hypothetical protein
MRAVDPVRATNSVVQPVWTIQSRLDAAKSVQTANQNVVAALGLEFFRHRLILQASMRADRAVVDTLYGRAMMDYPSNYKGVDPVWRPAAPADYYNLKYTAAGASYKVAAVTRPRLSDNTQDPRYTNDRFQSDYNLPRGDYSHVSSNVGAVAKILDWFALSGNLSSTFKPIDTSRPMMDGSIAEVPAAKGTELGVRFLLFNKGLQVNVNRYTSTQVGALESVNFPLNPILMARKTGDTTPGGINSRGLVPFGDSYYNTVDSKASGYELDLSGEVSRNLSVMFNFSISDVSSMNKYKESKAFFRENRTTLLAIMSDAGVDISNVTAKNESVPQPGSTNPDGRSAAGAWNTISAALTQYPDGAQTVATPLTRLSGKFYVRWRVPKMNGLRVGYGMQFYGPRAIGNKGANMIYNYDAAQKRYVGVDDPAVDSNNLLTVKGYALSSLTMEYSAKIFERQVVYNLAIQNLFDYREVRYVDAVMRLKDGDFTSPTIYYVNTPQAFQYQVPRTITLRATYRF